MKNSIPRAAQALELLADSSKTKIPVFCVVMVEVLKIIIKIASHDSNCRSLPFTYECIKICKFAPASIDPFSLST